MSFLVGSLDAISYMKEVAKSDRSTSRAAKRKACDTNHAQCTALHDISLPGWVRRIEVECILAEVSENNMNRCESERSSRIAASSRRVNDQRARKHLRRKLSGEGIVPRSNLDEPSSSQEPQTPAQYRAASSLLSSTPLKQVLPALTPSFRHSQTSHMPYTSALNSHPLRSQRTQAELSLVFLHSTRS